MQKGVRYEAPLALLEQADREMSAIPQDRLFNEAAHRKLTEKWCAAMFGLGYERHVAPCSAAVNDTADHEADFFIKVGNREYAFQLVETMQPERQRGAEFKALARGEVRAIPYEPERGHREGPNWIANTIAQKRAKHYSNAAALNILVYANFTARDLQHADVLKAATPDLRTFASVWVLSSLWLGSLYVGNDLGRIDGWGVIFTIEEANARFDNRQRSGS